MYWIEEFHEKLSAWWRSDASTLGPQEKTEAATEAYKALSKARARAVIGQEGGGGAAADGATSVEGTPSKKARKDRSRGDGGAGDQ